MSDNIIEFWSIQVRNILQLKETKGHGAMCILQCATQLFQQKKQPREIQQIYKGFAEVDKIDAGQDCSCKGRHHVGLDQLPNMRRWYNRF